MDFRRTILDYLEMFLRSYRERLAWLWDKSDNETMAGLCLMRAYDATRKLKMALLKMKDVTEMFEEQGEVIIKVHDVEVNTLLSQAARKGQADLADLLLSYGADVNHSNTDLDTPLSLAARHGHATTAALLIQAGADVNGCNRNFDTPLKLASSTGSVALVLQLLEAGAYTDHKNTPGNTALIRDIDGGYLSIVQGPLASGAEIGDNSNVDCNGLSVIMTAAKKGSLSLGHTLVQPMAQFNGNSFNDDAGDTPVLQATKQSLVDAIYNQAMPGEDVSALDSLSQCPLSITIASGNVDVVKCLLVGEADVSQRISGDTPLILAAQKGCVQCCQALIAYGAHINAINDNGDTALTLATRSRHLQVMKVLINAGANLNHINKLTLSPLRFAVGQSVLECSPCLLHLLDSGAEIHSELHYAVSVKLPHVVSTFIAYNALPKAINTKNTFPSLSKLPYPSVSPLCVALLTDSVDIAKYFLEIGFLMDTDLHILSRNAEFRRCLKDNCRNESLYFLDHQLPVPLSLYKLSFLAVSTALGFDSRSRHSKVMQTGLPPLLQRKLMFVT